MNRIKIRENTFKLLFCNEFHDKEEMPKQYEMYMNTINNITEEEIDTITVRVNDIIDKIPQIDQKINEIAVGWTTDRMGKVEVSIIRLAYYEMLIDDEIPQKVAVDQAVELAKKYGSDNSPNFVNGVLAKLFQED